jgi:hypothetical protein
MTPFGANPFTVLTLIAAPAVLTNASSVLALGTSNRFARAVDRARALSAMLETNRDHNSTLDRLRVLQLDRTEKRVILLLHALTCFYVALGSFAASALVSLLGSMFSADDIHLLFRAAEIMAIIAGFVGVGGLVVGCTILVNETRLAIVNLSDEAAYVRLHIDDYLSADDETIQPI